MKNNYAFIDGQNLHMGTSTEGWRIDFGRFRKYLSDKYDVTRAFFFLGYIPKNKKLYRTIEVAGFEIIFKEVTLQGSKIKGNVDVELTLEAAVRIDDYDQAVLVTADGDFACLVRYLYGQKKLKMVLSPSRRDCSSLLKKSAQRKICALWDFRDKIRTQNQDKIKGRHQPDSALS
uniref:NYN domain-containing protein n=1 Tax=Candidatus Kentrum sp. FW TaxID=2126338 RepID=A0A450RTD5_9GAMM|nr:MAG: NYN domain-containing protein [Candidatus Kentron sp. FW]